MEKRYQVFVGSTFKDLIDERQAVLKAVLELDHMPAGMELFPASDDTAWQLIKDVIDSSDYYVLIIGGRYGSLDKTGIGYTEREYEYAVKTDKPVIPLLHKNPDNLPREKTETDKLTWEKLIQFRKKVESNHTCVYWESAAELKAQVIVGLTSSVKRHPGIGWVRADKVPGEDTISEMLSLRKEIALLKNQLESERKGPPKEAEWLAQGEDEINIKCTFTARRSNPEYPNFNDTNYRASIDVTWNNIWKSIAPKLINECSELELNQTIRRYFTSVAKMAFKDHKDLKDATLREFYFSPEDIETCIVQFRALGLMKESIKNRSVKDTKTYWALTSYGDQLMVQLRAIKREPEEENELKSHVEGEVESEDS
jgi:hypothetical protein